MIACYRRLPTARQKTESDKPEIGTAEARALLKAIDATDLVGLPDRAILAVLIYTAARGGVVAKLTLKSLQHDGTQYALRFSEKGGKAREIPVRHDLEWLLLAYIQAAGITEGPLFRPAFRRTKRLTAKAMSGIDICRMMKRRLRAAGLPDRFPARARSARDSGSAVRGQPPSSGASPRIGIRSKVRSS